MWALSEKVSPGNLRMRPLRARQTRSSSSTSSGFAVAPTANDMCGFHMLFCPFTAQVLRRAAEWFVLTSWCMYAAGPDHFGVGKTDAQMDEGQCLYSSKLNLMRTLSRFLPDVDGLRPARNCRTFQLWAKQSTQVTYWRQMCA
eukprot:4187112-Amphidinium_carterae.1